MKPISLTIKPSKQTKPITHSVDLDSEAEFDPAPPGSPFREPPKPVSPPRSRKTRQEEAKIKPVEGRAPSSSAAAEKSDEPRPVPPPSINENQSLMPDRRRTRNKSSPERPASTMPDRRKTRNKSSPERASLRSSTKNKDAEKSPERSSRSSTRKHRNDETSHAKNTKSSKRRRSPSPVKKQHSPRRTRGQRAAEAKDAQNNMENFESLPTLWDSPPRKNDERGDKDVADKQSSLKRKSHSGSKSPRRARSPVKKSSSKSKTRSRSRSKTPSKSESLRKSKRKRDRTPEVSIL